MDFQSFFIRLSCHNYRISNPKLSRTKTASFFKRNIYVSLHKMVKIKVNYKHLFYRTLGSQTCYHGLLFLSSCKTKAQKAHFTSLQTELQPLLSFIQQGI